jgi:hypothetical protein
MPGARVTLDGYVVHATTIAAVGLRKANKPLETKLIWVPRSCLEDGDGLSVGDTDLLCWANIADDKGLDY